MANEANRAHWARSGEAWVANQRTFDRMLEPFGRLLMDAVNVARGERVLDVGCGFGTTALALRNAGAAVHGVDISAPMVAMARTRLPSATFEVADAQSDPLGGPYDVIASRFGVMFFDDPTVAFANLARHAAPAGRIVFVCWNDQPASTVVWAGSEVLRAALPSPPPPTPPHAPGPFGLADRDRTERILRDAGWTDVAITGHELACTIGWPESDGVEERLAVVLASEAGELFREQVAADARPPIVEKARESLRARVVDGALALSGSVWLVQARA